MEKYELQKLRDLPIEGVAERLGLRVRMNKALCPFHDDSHPSLSFKVSKNTCRCFVCMTQSIGPIDLVMRHLKLDFKAACRWLNFRNNNPWLTANNPVLLRNTRALFTHKKYTKGTVPFV